MNGQLAELYDWHDLIRLASAETHGQRLEFHYRDGERVPTAATLNGEHLLYLHYDQVGSLRVVADEYDNVVKEVRYTAFGAIEEDTNPDLFMPIGFAGGLHDRDLGWVRFGFRDYDPLTARFTAKDPLGYAGGDSDVYGYCLDDPVNGVDPMGLFAWVPIAGGLIGGGVTAYDDYDEWKSGKLSNWDYAKSIGLGAATGAASTLGGGLVGSVFAGAAAAGANEAGKQYIKKGKVDDWSKVGKQSAYGAAGGVAGNVVSKAGNSFIVQRQPIIGQKLSENGLKHTIKDASDLGGVVGDAVGSRVAGQTGSLFDKKEQRRTGR